jgi:hypothetical protein
MDESWHLLFAGILGAASHARFTRSEAGHPVEPDEPLREDELFERRLRKRYVINQSMLTSFASHGSVYSRW